MLLKLFPALIIVGISNFIYISTLPKQLFKLKNYFFLENHLNLTSYFWCCTLLIKNMTQNKLIFNKRRITYCGISYLRDLRRYLLLTIIIVNCIYYWTQILSFSVHYLPAFDLSSSVCSCIEVEGLLHAFPSKFSLSRLPVCF